MLVYARVPSSQQVSHNAEQPSDSRANSTSERPKDCLTLLETRIPPRALDVVNAMNAQYDQTCDEYAQR